MFTVIFKLNLSVCFPIGTFVFSAQQFTVCFPESTAMCFLTKLCMFIALVTYLKHLSYQGKASSGYIGMSLLGCALISDGRVYSQGGELYEYLHSSQVHLVFSSVWILKTKKYFPLDAAQTGICWAVHSNLSIWIRFG